MTVSLVTGAGSGIGRAVALALAARGDAVVCADLDLAAASATAAEAGGAATEVGVDVADAASCDAAVATAVARLGRRRRVLVCCAGIELGGAADQLSDDVWQQGAGRQSDGQLLLRPRGGTADDRAGGRRADRSDRFDQFSDRPWRSGRVLRLEGWRADARSSPRRRLGAARDHGQHRRPGCRRHPYVGAEPRRSRSAGPAHVPDPDRPTGRTRARSPPWSPS